MKTLGDEIESEKSNQNLINKERIMLTYKEIELICNVPKVFHNITKLYLSNNSISSLTGIEVFKNLAYFSISHNFIERFEELLKISNPEKIVSLSVKGNYFCKNPQSNLLIIKHFNNLSEIDGYKVNENTFKTIESGKKLSKFFIPFMYLIEKNHLKLIQLINILKLNIEIEAKFSKFSDEDYVRTKLQNINLLVNKFGIPLEWKSNISKYLKQNLNPSTHVILKVINMFTDDPFEEFKPSSRLEITNIYENVFKEIIKIYTLKNNYSSLPGYLNYKIIKSNIYLEKFFVLKTIENKDTDFNNNHTKIINHLSKHFDKYLVQYSTSSTNLLQKLQMMIFYNLQPPQASIIYNHFPVFDNSEYELVYKDNRNHITCSLNENDLNNLNYSKTKENKEASQIEKYKRFYDNPFLSGLKKRPDIVPNQNLKIELVKKENDYEIPELDSYLLLESEVCDSIEKINLFPLVNVVTNFFQNYSPFEFPIFCMNFDYMRVLMNIIQEKIRDLNSLCENIDKILLQYPREIRNLQLMKNSSVKPPVFSKNISNKERNNSKRNLKDYNYTQEKKVYSNEATHASNNEITSKSISSKKNKVLLTPEYTKTFNTINSKKDMYIEENLFIDNNFTSIETNDKFNEMTYKSDLSSKYKGNSSIFETQSSSGRKILIKGMSNLLNSPKFQQYYGNPIFIVENSKKFKDSVINLFSILNKIYRINTRSFFTLMINQKINQFVNCLFKVENKIKHFMKRFFFFEIVKLTIKQHRIDDYYRKCVFRKKSLAFKILYSLKCSNEFKSNQHLFKNLVGKSFYCLKSYSELSRFKYQRFINSRNFYIKRLILKSFKSLKFQLFKKQLIDEEQSNNTFDDKLIFNFFHQDSKTLLQNSRMKFMEKEISSKKSIRNKSTSKDEYKKKNFNKDLNDFENSKSFLDTLKNSHCSNIFSKNMYSKNHKDSLAYRKNERLEIKDFSNNEVDNFSNISYIPKRKNKNYSNNEIATKITTSKAIDSHTEIDELLNNLHSKYNSISKNLSISRKKEKESTNDNKISQYDNEKISSIYNKYNSKDNLDNYKTSSLNKKLHNYSKKKYLGILGAPNFTQKTMAFYNKTNS